MSQSVRVSDFDAAILFCLWRFSSRKILSHGGGGGGGGSTFRTKIEEQHHMMQG